MILSLEELKRHVVIDQPDEVLQMKLDAIESGIRDYTRNRFQNRGARSFVEVYEGKIVAACSGFFSAGDTVQLSGSAWQDGLYVVLAVSGNVINVKERLVDEASPGLSITRIDYPASVKAGVVDLMRWEAAYRDKVGLSGETLSRHSVSYAGTGAGDSLMGYPAQLLGFLKPYMRMRT